MISTALGEAFAQIDDTRPTVIIAYTIKGHALPTEGHPQNHSSLLTVEQFDRFRGGNWGWIRRQPVAAFRIDGHGRTTLPANRGRRCAANR